MRMRLLKVWRDLTAHKGQFIGLALVVALGVSAFVAFQTSYLDLARSVERANRELDFADFSTTVLGAPGGELAAIRRIPGVLAAEGRLIQDVALDLAEEQRATARIVGLPNDGRPSVDNLLLISGRWPVAGRGEGLLHVKFANETGSGPGSTLTLRRGGTLRHLRIVGVVASPEYMYAVPQKGALPSPREFAVLFLRARDAEDILDRPGIITDVAVILQPGASPARVIEEVERELDPYAVVATVRRADQPSNFMLGEEIEQNRVMALFLPAIILAISAATLFIAMSRLVTSHRGEIGLQKALGSTDTQILLHYLTFSLVVAIAGSAAGFVLGDWIARAVAEQYVTLLGIPFLDHGIHLDVVAQAVGLSSASCLLAGLVPAWRSARIPPALAMHADPNTALTGGGIPVLERILSPLLPRTSTVRIPLRNLFRLKRRSLSTVVGIAFALLLTVATQSMFDAMDDMVGRIEHGSELWDVQSVFDQPFGAPRVAEVRRWDGVTGVVPATMIAADVEGPLATHHGAITCADPPASFHGFEIVDGPGPQAALVSGGLILPQTIATKLGVGVGGHVRVRSPERDEWIDVSVAALSQEMLGSPMFADTQLARRLQGGPAVRYNALYLNGEAWAVSSIKERLLDLPGAVSVSVKAEMLARFQEMMQFTRFYQAILLAFGIAMAAVVIHTTLTANVLERSREIATMRTIGESTGRIAWMITLENLLLGLAAAPLGIWLGIRTADLIYAQFSSEAFTLTASIKPQSVALIVGLLVLVMLLSEALPIRRVARMDLAEATKVLE